MTGSKRTAEFTSSMPIKHDQFTDMPTIPIPQQFPSEYQPRSFTTSRRHSRPTFFDGSYFSADDHGKLAIGGNKSRHSFFDYSVPEWNILYTLTLLALDMLMSLLSTAIVLVSHSEAYVFLISQTSWSGGAIKFLLVIGLSWVASLGITHTFERHTMGEGYELYSKIYAATFIYFIFLATFSYLFKLDIPRSLTIFVPLLTAIFTTFERWMMRRALHRNRNRGEFNYPTVVVGSLDGIHRILDLLQEHKGLGYAPIAVCPVDAHADMRPDAATTTILGPQSLTPIAFTPRNDFERSLRVLPMNSHLPQTAKNLKAQTILIADVIQRTSETMRTLSLATESMGLELAFSSSVADLDGASLHLRNHPSMPVFTAKLSQYSSMTKLLKRLFDILGSSIALIVASPVMAYVAIRVKSEDGGPAIYKQERIGLYGQPFTLYKFRSMTVDADKEDAKLAERTGTDHGILFKPRNDPRVTEFGHFIRKTSLDEFPQFLNVLKGDMSLVGPRPQQQYEVDQYGTLYSSRLLVKPGITGPWQISGRSDLSRKEAEQLDVSYIQNWSLTGDIAILLKTVGAVIRGTGSY